MMGVCARIQDLFGISDVLSKRRTSIKNMIILILGKDNDFNIPPNIERTK